MAMLTAALLLQAAIPASHAAAVPQQFSILLPECPKAENRSDIIVCAGGRDGQRLPLPDERVPGGPIPSNPRLDGAGAMAVAGTPCAASQWGCQVGVGPPIVPIAKALVSAAKSAFAKKPDKTGRIPIPLD